MATVFKDECTYTFDNQESEHGVDVCLKCFIGTSSDPAHDFTAQHARANSGHTAFLNLRKREVLPRDTSSAPEPKTARLAIEPEKEREFEQVHSFKTLESDAESDFAAAIAKVLSADSYTKKQQLESWELELQPCEHVAMLSSLPPARPADYELLAHCSSCDLSTNLWLCLSCGNLGCGRRHYDNTGGNNHGIEHYSATQHPLAVKLGSITPDGHVDVYCYACDDDVSDPDIRAHLAAWGVDIASRTKTEKSMTELQLEQNLNYDFTSSDAGHKVSGAGFTGMSNLGNTCYMNSVMQCLFSIPELSSEIGTNDAGAVKQLGGPEDLETQLRKLNDGLQSGRYDAVSPNMLRYLIGKNHAEFATARQQDAFEYLSYVLTQIERNAKRRSTAKLPQQLFGFQSERRIACASCDAVRYTTSNEENISVAVPIEELEGSAANTFRPVSMEELLKIYTQTEDIESKCSKCGGSQATSCLRFKTFPKYLIVNVRRFRIVNWVPQKVDVPVTQPQVMNLDEFISTGPKEGENVIEDDDELDGTTSQSFKPDAMKLEMLMSMGFSSELATQALKIASERGYGEGDFDAAVEILVSGEAQQALDAAAHNTKTKNGTPDTSELEAMGFPKEQAVAALTHTSSAEEAIEWLFNGSFDMLQQQQQQQQQQQEEEEQEPTGELGSSDLPANYTLNSTVCHKGASVHVGHYVAAVRKENETYLFNDEKVTQGSDVNELEKFAYIYIFARQ